MKAKVKRIKLGTVLDIDGHQDSFESGMLRMAKSGKVFEFVPFFGAAKWFTCTNGGWEFNFHVSWLKEIKK